eukprot:7363523-Pyramimonas_sp.AAC.1
MSFKNNHKSWRAFLCDYLGVNMKDAKRALIRLVHLVVPRNDLPFPWNLSREIKEAVKRFLSLPQLSHLQKMFHEKPNPTATRLHCA